ncbi:MAG: hypothetical protein Q9227_006095 [Pyrenula ochraceoflavens]
MDGRPAVAKKAGGQQVRVAVEGCGHGSLHAIYSSLQTACQAQGWSNVDVLIICGDFQAVRNKLDLNVTAMPAKYRHMMDFNEYYSGVRKAPCLTVFVGGNHEASNHLFELYYGGWVAPNIYYLGAANVLRLGPLRISALSGIWKGYDYHKPHFERLPYSYEDYYGIYHVRELDVRKLLNIRTQVDIGLSHDWPRGIEWHGDSEHLFQRKRGFEEDASSGKLGSVAAQQCLDRLRPPHWFSAHLHVKYPAILEHQEYRPARIRRAVKTKSMQSAEAVESNSQKQSKTPEKNGIKPHVSSKSGFSDANNDRLDKVSAWRDFGTSAAKKDAEDAELTLEERLAKYTNGAENSQPVYTFNEVWKPVKTNDDLGREVQAASKSTFRAEEGRAIPQVDGAMSSRVIDYFRPKQNPDELDIDVDVDESAPQSLYSGMQKAPSTKAVTDKNLQSNNRTKNENEIDIDMSSEDDHPKRSGPPTSADYANGNSIDVDRLSLDADEEAAGSIRKAETSNHDAVETQDTKQNASPSRDLQTQKSNRTSDSAFENGHDSSTVANDAKIPKDVREELAAISSSFAAAPQEELTPVPENLPSLPSAIHNKTTHFLALDKVEPGRKRHQYLQLLEISPFSDQKHPDTDTDSAHAASTHQRPFRLTYDKEWLAITRVFASDLHLSGSPADTVPQNLGDAYYSARIAEEEEWVEQNIVQKNLLTVPENFKITAPVYNAEEREAKDSMPREYSNPQTEAFCRLVGIENKFAISEQEIEERIARGPRPSERGGGGGGGGWRGGRNQQRGGKGFHGGGRGGGGGGRGGGQRGRGGYGRGRGGRSNW